MNDEEFISRLNKQMNLPDGVARWRQMPLDTRPKWRNRFRSSRPVVAMGPTFAAMLGATAIVVAGIGLVAIHHGSPNGSSNRNRPVTATVGPTTSGTPQASSSVPLNTQPSAQSPLVLPHSSSTAPPPTMVVSKNSPVLAQPLWYSDNTTGTPQPLNGITTSQTELLVAFVASDGPPGAAECNKPPAPADQQVEAMTTSGLQWTLRVRANKYDGDAEIWTAIAPPLSNASVSITRKYPNYNDTIVVAGFVHYNAGQPIGSVGSNPSPPAPDSVSLVATSAGSLVWGVGDDYGGSWMCGELVVAPTRTIGPGQTMAHEDHSTSNGDDYWVQYLNTTTSVPGQQVTLNDTAPATDQSEFVGVEILG